MQKENKGITLVALVITIAIMLILAGVTISVSLKGGLFSKANEATSQMQIEAEKEQLLMATLGALGRNGKVDLTKLDSNLPTGFQKTGTGTYKSSTGNIYQVTEDADIILLNGTEGEPEEPDTPVVPPANPTITLSTTQITREITKGTPETVTLTATLNNVNGDLTWTSSDTSVAEISGNGTTRTITLKKAGTASITVSYGTQATAICSITVTEKQVSVEEDELAGLWIFNKTLTPIDSDDYIFSYNSYMFGELDTFSVWSDEEIFGISVYDSSYPDSWDNIYVYEYYEGGTEKGWRHCLGRLFEITSTLDEMENGEKFLTWLKANAVKTTESEISIITFIIDGNEDYVLEGMTWGEWATYLYSNCTTDGQYIYNYDNNLVYYGSGPVRASDEIISGGEYFVQTLGTDPT